MRYEMQFMCWMKYTGTVMTYGLLWCVMFYMGTISWIYDTHSWCLAEYNNSGLQFPRTCKHEILNLLWSLAEGHASKCWGKGLCVHFAARSLRTISWLYEHFLDYLKICTFIEWTEGPQISGVHLKIVVLPGSHVGTLGNEIELKDHFWNWPHQHGFFSQDKNNTIPWIPLRGQNDALLHYVQICFNP